MADLIPHVLVALVALGMGFAFWSADRESRTSLALAVGLGSIGVAILVNMVLHTPYSPHPADTGWFALPEAIAIIAELEWLLRVRATVPVAAGMSVRAGDYALRAGQLAGVVYLGLSLAFPELRVSDFLQATQNHGLAVFGRGGFWLFATPVLFATVAGLVSILLLLNRRPDRGEKIRVLAMALAVPFFVAGFVLPPRFAALTTVIGEIIFLIGAVHYHVLQGQRGQFMSRFLSPQVARIVAERGLKSAMQQNELEITVVCCDLRGFTAYAEAHDSTRVLQVLRDYYDAVGKVVADFGGTIKDFAGDGILILVGAPLPVPHHARCGLEMARRIRSLGLELTARWSVPGHTLGIGLGVATGTVTVGVIGSASRLEYTAVGSAVNLASRLCELAASGEILVDQHTEQRAGRFGLETRAPLPIKGFREGVPHYALMRDPAPLGSG